MINQVNPTNEVELMRAEKAVALSTYEAMNRLLENEDFKQIVLEGYLKTEAARITSLLAAPGMQQFRSAMFEALAGISHFEQYLITINSLGATVSDTEDEE